MKFIALVSGTRPFHSQNVTSGNVTGTDIIALYILERNDNVMRMHYTALNRSRVGHFSETAPLYSFICACVFVVEVDVMIA